MSMIKSSEATDDPGHYFRLPTDRVVEVGSQITI
jgi:K+ transporter